MKAQLITLLLCSVLFWACKNDDQAEVQTANPPPSTPTHQELIVGTWRLQSSFYCGCDLPYYFPFESNPCKDDDLMVINADGSYSWEEGATKCNAADPDICEVGTWSLSDNGSLLTRISLDSVSGTNVVNVIGIDSVLHISWQIACPDSPFPSVMVFYYQRQ